MKRKLVALSLLCACGVPLRVFAAESSEDKSPFARDNLIAWCVVPFDAKKRGPEERAAMLARLGITRLAYDWRDKDIPTFDAEIAALNKHHVKMHAFWCPVNSAAPAKERHIGIILDVLKRNNVKTELWVSLSDAVVANVGPDRKVQAAAQAIGHLANEANKIGCKVGLYNHGGWFGSPDNQIAIIKQLKMKNVGIVYNFHHAHHEMDRFEPLLQRMKPYLLAINLNGMKKGGAKILPIGKGDRELDMLRTVRRLGYQGPVGILDHRGELDAEESLRENLEGLKVLLGKMGETKALATYAKP